MDLNARKDHFSRAVVRAVAAAAGVGASVPELDQDSEDIEFAAPDTAELPGARTLGAIEMFRNARSLWRRIPRLSCRSRTTTIHGGPYPCSTCRAS